MGAGNLSRNLTHRVAFLAPPKVGAHLREQAATTSVWVAAKIKRVSHLERITASSQRVPLVPPE